MVLFSLHLTFIESKSIISSLTLKCEVFNYLLIYLGFGDMVIYIAQTGLEFVV